MYSLLSIACDNVNIFYAFATSIRGIITLFTAPVVMYIMYRVSEIEMVPVIGEDSQTVAGFMENEDDLCVH